MVKLVKQMEPQNIFQSLYWLQTQSVDHTRKVYNILDLLSDLGGVLEIISLLFGFLILPISEFSFILKAAKRLYMVRAKDQSLFLNNT